MLPIQNKDIRVVQATTLKLVNYSSSSYSGTVGDVQILDTPGFSESYPPAIFDTSTTSKGAMERIPGTDGFIQTLSGYTPVYPGGMFNALHPYDEVRGVRVYSVQSASFLSTDQAETSLSQMKNAVQNVLLPEYFGKYGARYKNEVLNKNTLLLSRPLMTPSWFFDHEMFNTNYDISNGFSSFAWIAVHQDDVGSDDVFNAVTTQVGISPPADITVSSGLSPVLTILSGNFAGFSTGSSSTTLSTINGLQPPFVCFSWGINKDSSGDRRIYILAATGSGQTDIFSAQSDPINIDDDSWFHAGVRWENIINNKTGSFVLNGENIGDFVLDTSSVACPTTTGSEIFNYYNASYDKSIITSAANLPAGSYSGFYSNVDGLITLGNLGQIRYYGATSPSGKEFPITLGSAKLIELHDIVLFNKFVELEDILPYYSGSVSYNNSSNPIFYVPVAVPRLNETALTGTTGNDSFYEYYIQPREVNCIDYFSGSPGPSSFFYNGEDLGINEAHILQLAQLGADLSINDNTESTIDKLSTEENILNSQWSNFNNGKDNGVYWDKEKNPLKGWGSQFLINSPLIDVVNLYPPTSVISISGSLSGVGTKTIIPACPYDLFINNSSSSYGYSTRRILPSNNHDFVFDAEDINTWISISSSLNTIALTGSNSSFMGLAYNDWGYYNRIEAATEKKTIKCVPNTISYYVSGSQTVLSALSDRTVHNHFINTATNINKIFYIPKVLLGDDIKKGSVSINSQINIFKYNGEILSPFGQYYSTLSTSSIDNDFNLSFIDNGYGGLIRGPYSTSEMYNEIGSILYDRGIIVQKHPGMFWIGEDNSTYDNGINKAFELNFTSSNKSFIREMELTIPKNKNIIPISENMNSGSLNYIDIYDNAGNCLERIGLAQSIERLSGSAITIRSYMVF